MRSGPRLAAAALLAIVVTSGCAGVPDSGPVHVGQQVQAAGGLADNDIRVLAPPPLPGMTPTALVTGFLRAMIDSQDDYAVARTYLANGAQWNPAAGITTYDEGSATVLRSGANTVDVHVTRVGTIDDRGDYRIDPGELARRFTVVRQNGEWRISAPSGGILLSTVDAARALQAANLYYLDQSQRRLVPEQVLVQPDQPGLGTTLIRTLLAGPGSELAGAARSALPAGTQLLGNVPVDVNGVAEVNLSGTVRQLPTNALQALSAQVDWTLSQLSDVNSVRLLVDGLTLSVPGVASPQPVQSWQSFDPDATASRPLALVSVSGHVAAIGGTVPRALTVAGITAPTVSADRRSAAALRPAGRRTQLLLGPADGALRPVLTASSVSAPTWAPDGGVMVVVRRPSGERVVLVPPGGRIRVVAVSSRLLAGPIHTLSVSRDGTRVAIVAGPVLGSELIVAPLRPSRGSYSLGAVTEVFGGDRAVAGVAWAAAGELVATVAQGNRRIVVETDPDGYQPKLLAHSGLPNAPTQVAAAPGAPILAATAGGVWAEVDGHWQRVSTGDDPSYGG